MEAARQLAKYQEAIRKEKVITLMISKFKPVNKPTRIIAIFNSNNFFEWMITRTLKNSLNHDSTKLVEDLVFDYY